MSDRRLFLKALAEMSGNPKQLEAVNATEHCVVLAGPGSGKTKTLTTAMARALLDDIEEPRAIACITYNNECAIELQNRLARLGIESPERAFVGTVHSFALSQVILPYGRCVMPGFAVEGIATKHQMADAIAVAYKTVTGRNDSPRSMWARAATKRQEDIDRTHAMWMGRSPELARLIEAYEAELRRQRLVDFEDMPLLAMKIVTENEWVRRALYSKFPVLFVDEYQDLGAALHELVLQLCFRGGIRLFAVGDPDQSIYRFTGANAALLKDLAAREDVRAVELPFNYRCGTRIIDASKAALGEERDHRGPEGAPAGIISFDPVDGELAAQADYIMGEVIPALRASGIDLGQIATLYRGADGGNRLAAAAAARSIPIVRADKHALIPRNNRLSRLIETAAQWVTGGWKTADPPFRRLLAEALMLVYGGRASRSERRELEEMLAAFLHRTINSTGSTHAWLIDFRDSLLSHWRARARITSEDWDILDTMIERTNGAAGNSDLPLPQFSGRVEASGRLNLSTLHSSKGREFDVVIMYDMNKGSIPGYKDEESAEQLTDARRLFYVGVTRARKQLHLVFKRKHYSPWVAELYRRGKKSGWIV